MTAKNIQKKFEIIDNTSRENKIIDFLRDNSPCSKQAIIEGVRDFSSPKTTLKILKSLEERGIIKTDKEKPNSRAYTVTLIHHNPLIVIHNQMQEFNNEFKKLLKKIEIAIPQLVLLPINTHENRKKNFETLLFYQEMPLFILKYLIECLLLKTISVWPNNSKNEVRKQLNSLAFTIISEIVSDFSNFYHLKLKNSKTNFLKYKPNIPKELSRFSIDYSYTEYLLLFLTQSKIKGIDKEYGNVLDKLWLINSDVQILLHPEGKKYKFGYKYGKEDWRKYFQLYKSNITVIEEEEKSKSHSLYSMGYLNFRNFF